MLRNCALRVPFWLGLIALTSPLALGQDTTAVNIHPYHGPTEHVEGVFVTPVSNAPFTAIVVIESSQVLSDGSRERKTTRSHIARDSGGRIHNELRAMRPADFEAMPRLLSTHIYDPVTRLSTFLNPATRLARQTLLPAALPTPPPFPPKAKDNPLIKDEDLGTETLEDVVVHGLRRTQTVPENLSGTGKEVVVTDEYWYSDDLHLNILVKHNDPRTGEQTVTVTHVNRAEPEASLFQVPPDYKIVDETPNNK